MKRLVALMALAAASPACAEQIDLSTQTCQQFVSAPQEEVQVILTWLDAYYKSEDAPPIIDTDKFVENAKMLGAYCAANPTVGLITAADKLFGK